MLCSRKVQNLIFLASGWLRSERLLGPVFISWPYRLYRVACRPAGVTARRVVHGRFVWGRARTANTAAASMPVARTSRVVTAAAGEAGKHGLAVCQKSGKVCSRLLFTQNKKHTPQKTHCEFSVSKPEVSDLLTLPQLLAVTRSKNLFWPNVMCDVGCRKQKLRAEIQRVNSLKKEKKK